MTQIVKYLPTIQETRVQSLEQEDHLEKGIATHSSILAWRITWTEELDRLQSMGLQRVRHDWGTNTSTFYSGYNLNKQGDNIQPWRTPFPIWDHSVVPSPVISVASWPAYRFLKRQVKWSVIPISWRIFHSLLWSTVKDFGIVNKAEIEYDENRQPAHYT